MSHLWFCAIEKRFTYSNPERAEELLKRHLLAQLQCEQLNSFKTIVLSVVHSQDTRQLHYQINTLGKKWNKASGTAGH